MNTVDVDKRLVVLLSAEKLEHLKGIACKYSPGEGSVEKFTEGEYYYEIGCWRDILGECHVSGFPFLDKVGRVVPNL